LDARQSTVTNIYLPIAGNGIADPAASIFDNPFALAFYRLLNTDPRQKRATLDPCPTLVAAARHRAAMLATMPDIAHVDPDGTTPNEIARRFGCALPSDYPERGNGIESLVAGTGDPQAAFTALANSPSHAKHLFALDGDGRADAYYGRQNACGIALTEVAGSRWGWYWVVLLAPCG